MVKKKKIGVKFLEEINKSGELYCRINYDGKSTKIICKSQALRNKNSKIVKDIVRYFSDRDLNFSIIGKSDIINQYSRSFVEMFMLLVLNKMRHELKNVMIYNTYCTYIMPVTHIIDLDYFEKYIPIRTKNRSNLSLLGFFTYLKNETRGDFYTESFEDEFIIYCYLIDLILDKKKINIDVELVYWFNNLELREALYTKIHSKKFKYLDLEQLEIESTSNSEELIDLFDNTIIIMS